MLLNEVAMLVILAIITSVLFGFLMVTWLFSVIFHDDIEEVWLE